MSSFSFDFSAADAPPDGDGVMAPPVMPMPSPPVPAYTPAPARARECVLCGAACTDVSIPLLKRLSDAKLLFEACEAEFKVCVELRCPPSAAPVLAPSAGGHAACRDAFSRRFYVPVDSLGPWLHCCWSIDDVRAMFRDSESVTCSACCDGLYDVLATLERCVAVRRTVEVIV
jgi:hypothetical protein